VDALYAFLKANADVTNALATLASAAIGLAALVVSVVAIVIARRTLHHQQAHNVLSVRPIPMLATADYEECVSVSLRNHGVGPMLIKTMHVSEGDTQQAYVRQFMPALPKDLAWSTYAGELRDVSLPAGEQVILLELKGQEDDPAYSAFRDQCRAALGRLAVTVEYTDVYGSSFPPYRDLLTWYARARSASSEPAPPTLSVPT
jgi:hypothetical protein